jgi:iron complex outermembrane receptor protein
MSYKKLALFGAAATVAIVATQSGVAFAQAAAPGAVSEVIVTAQKRQENIQNVGMSIQAASGDKLTKLGVTDTASLQKIVPGFVFTPTYYGTLVYTIRGVGFQDTSLAGSPTVSVYLDEAPMPFSALTNGASLDLQRVEVLKGPQGTLFGNNATGGAINYIANKPTDTFQAGMDLTYGRFSDVNVQGYVSGPIADGLDARIALQSHTSGAWQKGYATQAGQSIGGQDFLNGRMSLQWKPNDRFKALLTLSGWQDKGYTQMGQLYGVAALSPLGYLDPLISAYPKGPHNDQAAGWNQCVNIDPFDPIAGQSGAVGLDGLGPLVPTGAPGVYESEGAGSTVQAGGQPTHCIAPRKNNTYYSGTLRMDYSLTDDITLTSLTEYQKFNRRAGIDGSGMPIQDYQSDQHGNIMSVFQELRLAGKFNGKGSWILGANYEYDNTYDRFLQTYNASAAAPTMFSDVFGLPLGPTAPTNIQKTDTYAVYANAEYPILDKLTLQGGVRFTQENKTGYICGEDGGDGTWSNVAYVLQEFLGSSDPVMSPAGACATVGPASQNFNSPANGGLYVEPLNQNNVSWRVGLNYKLAPGSLLYFNVSKGYKGGSFPTVAMSTYQQAHPVVQEGLLAYEGGFKSTLFDKQLTINGAGFYYDYTDKQILGAISDPLFGALPALVNVPQSHVIGFELSGVYTPEWLHGLTVTPAVSYQHTNIDTSGRNTCDQSALNSKGNGSTCIPGHFYNFDAFNEYTDFTNEKFPSAPEWQASVDAEYDWTVRDDLTAFVGVNVAYTSQTNTFFVNRSPNEGQANDPTTVNAYTLVDLRAGIAKGDWRFQLWGHNVTNAYYWTAADHVNDVLLRYTGMPTTYGFTLSYRYK